MHRSAQWLVLKEVTHPADMDPELKTEHMAADKRRYQRRPAPGVGLVNVYALGPGRRKFLCCSLLQDISEGGVGIRTDVALPKGTALQLDNRCIEYNVRVTRCSAAGGGFLIGLEFEKEPL